MPAAAPIMPMVRLTLSLEGELVIDRVLRGLESRAQNLTPAWPGVLQAFYTITRAAFNTEGASTGAQWAQLAPSTQRDRQRKGFAPAHPILQRTHTLERALTGGGGAFASTGPSRLALILSGEAGAYFKFHQSNRPRTLLPRRAPVLFTADDRHALLRPVRLYLAGRAA
jgi:hypothetical protein